jgi:hypothetical protein
MASFHFKTVSKIGESPFVFRRVIYNTSEKTWIFPFCLLSYKQYRLFIENIIRKFQRSFTITGFILQMASFSYYEVRFYKIYCKKPFKIKISSIKDIVGIRLERNRIHGIHVMNFCLSNMKKSWNVCNNIIKGMNFNTSFGSTKVRPQEKLKHKSMVVESKA